MTKIGKYFCEKAYTLEIFPFLGSFFGSLLHGHGCRRFTQRQKIEKEKSFFEKTLDKRVEVVYNNRAKQSRVLPLTYTPFVIWVNIGSLP